jgi:hypothetical protein
MNSKLNLCVLDFETFYDTKYSLGKITTAEYILDPRFQIVGVSVSYNGQKARWFSGTLEQIIAWLQQFDIENSIVVAHNAMFDGAILEWVIKRKPAKYFCTMMASRPNLVPFNGSMALRTTAESLGVGFKGVVREKAQGIRREDFPEWLLQSYANYCCHDTELSAASFIHLWRSLPDDERYLIDLTIKKYTRPQICLDPEVLNIRLEQVKDDKAKALLCIPNGVDKKDLMSNARFAEVLRRLGVEPEQKISPSTGLLTHAFSKQDTAMVDLMNHPDEVVRNVVRARLLIKSSLEETRLARLQAIARLTARREMAIPLLYYGAHTGRFSGLDFINMQNLPRPKKGIKSMRHALIAPPGHKVVTVDLSQIEARIVAVLAGCTDLIRQFANGEDPYSKFATIAYGYEVKKATHPIERFVGKTCILGLGYGVGHVKLLATLKSSAAKDGLTINLEEQDARGFVNTYRNTYWQIPQLWRQLNNVVLGRMLRTDANPTQWGMLLVEHQKLTLPNGMAIHYPGLTKTDDREITYEDHSSNSAPVKYLWGGSLLENIVQALARIIISRAEIRLSKAGLHAALQVHDELVYVVRDEHIERVKRALVLALTDPVPWLPNLPLACEVGVGQSYGDAK